MQNDNGDPSTSTVGKKSTSTNTSDKSTQTTSTVNRRVVFGTWNVRSLEGKIEKIISEIEKVDADVVVLTETKKKIITKHSNTGGKNKKKDLSSGTKSKTCDSSSSGPKSNTSDSGSGAKSKSSDLSCGTKSETSDSSSEKKSKGDDSSSETKNKANDISSGTKSKTSDSSSGTKSKANDSSCGTKSETSDLNSGKKSKANDLSSGTKSKSSESSSGTKSKSSDLSPRTESETSDSSSETKSKSSDLSSGTKRNENAEDSFTEAERNESTKDSSNPKKEYFGDYTHIYSGVREGRAQAGVSIIFKTHNCFLYDWEAVSERIITAKMNIGGQKFIIIGVYGLSENASSDMKDDFNSQLYNELIKASEPLREENYELVLLGDFNSKVGISTSSAVGKYGDDEFSENGYRLLRVCDDFELKIQNTFFEHQDVHKYTRYAKPSLIDFFITESDTNLKVHDVMACKWLECGTDHVFVKAIVSIPTEEDKKKTNSKTTEMKKKSKAKISLSQLEILEMLYASSPDSEEE